MQPREHPPINFRTVRVSNWFLRAVVAVDIRVQHQEIVRVVQRSKELSLHLANPIFVELQVVPWLRVGDHIPAGRIRSVFL